MHYCTYQSPIGSILLATNGQSVCGLWFADSAHCPAEALSAPDEGDLPLCKAAKDALSRYFAGEATECPITLDPRGTPFQLAVWKILAAIPYGQTVTYGDIARQMAAITGKSNMSAQAIGGAVGRNPISILIPCHRVIGSDGSLTGYAGGIERKRYLLKLEQTFQ